MPVLFLAPVVLAVLLALAWIFVNTDPKALVRTLRYFIGGLLLLAGAALMLGQRFGFGLMLLFFGFSAIFQGRIGPWSFGGTTRSEGQGSRVSSAFLEMTLDHDTGTMTGRVLAGTYAGRQLDDLDGGALRALLAEAAADADSVRLLEAYLDRREPGWREDLDEDAAARPGASSGSGPMSEEEAYQILGLQPGALEADIRAAHRRLMKQFHPDQGGSTFLAAKINEAKERLLGKHR